MKQFMGPARDKIHLRPTRYCGILGGVLLATWAAAVNYENNLSYFVLSILISLALVSAVHAWRNITDLEVVAGKAEPVFAGQNACIGFFIENPRGDDAYAVVLDHPEISMVGDAPKLSRLPSRSSQPVDWMIPAPERGSHQISGARITTIYPLGLFRAWRWFPVNVHYLVYPKPHGSRSWTEGEGGEFSFEGGPRKSGDDFYGLRSYVPGDSQRHIHWKVVARGGPLMVKEFGGSGGTGLWFDWSSLDGLDVEARLSQMTMWILRARHENLAYGLRLPGLVRPPGNGPRHEQECLAALALFESRSMHHEALTRHKIESLSLPKTQPKACRWRRMTACF